ncbi:hypothetical protein [Metabacillus niabensis]|uniref:hypothetical protein n=1 Tax=Metabacillus niabensis TaxID=324854 RepID=UPI001CFA8728|nr:hypothetical protein [Metabacillus niabensis]
MTTTEKARRIKEITNEIIRLYVKDNKGIKESEQERAVELLASAIQDFSEIYLNKNADDDEMLKGILAKVKIASNIIDEVKKPKVVIKRV